MTPLITTHEPPSRVLGLWGLRVQGLGFRVSGGLGFQGSGFRLLGFGGFRGLGFSVWGFRRLGF